MFEATLLPRSSYVIILNLNDTHLTKVPSAVKQMKSLYVVRFNDNNINSITDFAVLSK